MNSNDILSNLILQNKEKLSPVIDNPAKYKVQIIYTQIDRNEKNDPIFTSYHFGDEDQYFYPASTVKMPTAFLALERLNELGIEKLNKNTTMHTDSAFSGQSRVQVDSSSSTGLPTIAHYIKKIFVVSDNDGYNRLYEFLGQHYINSKLHEKGFSNTRIIHRLSIPLSEEENRNTNPVLFKENNDTIYLKPEAYNKDPLPTTGDLPLGIGYINADGELVNEPMNFRLKNYMPLDEMQMMLRAVLFPDHVDSAFRFRLNEDDYHFLYQYMSQLPQETTFPSYDSKEFFPAYSKFLIYGSDVKAQIPDHIRIFNKIGLAYGYVIDNAYVVDFKNKVEFLLSAVVYVNENQIYNDGKYEYDSIGFPFMKALGEIIYTHELKRERQHSPDLSRFKLTYDKPIL